ncbi:MAG: hypothetical protein WC076_04555 [Terrimicrobiaceae bacterium]|jgi:hypothetical protein|nr:hypothetical protein [Terrimicrobiaceae bacterium]
MKSKAELLADIARSRAAIRRDTSAVRAELDLAAKIQNSVRSRPFAWLGGAAAIGYFFAGPKTRTKTVTKIARGKSGDSVSEAKKNPRGFPGLLFSLLKLSLPLVRPALTAYAAKRFGDYAQKLAK